MEIIIGLLFAIAAGSVARRVMPGPSSSGIVTAMCVGLAGGLIGGLLGTYFIGRASSGLDARSLLMAIAGTLWLLFLYRSLAMRSNSEERMEYQS